MRKRLTLFVATLVSLLVLAPPAAAHHGGACPTPTAENGRDFAMMHIVPLAHAGVLGQGHKPGSHKGFSGCHPQQDAPGQQP